MGDISTSSMEGRHKDPFPSPNSSYVMNNSNSIRTHSRIIQDSAKIAPHSSLTNADMTRVVRAPPLKRGKYRNYDQMNVVQAIQAVKQGVLSVHRAGFYYGVPHSTLKYEVRKRHLLT